MKILYSIHKSLPWASMRAKSSNENFEQFQCNFPDFEEFQFLDVILEAHRKCSFQNWIKKAKVEKRKPSFFIKLCFTMHYIKLHLPDYIDQIFKIS